MVGNSLDLGSSPGAAAFQLCDLGNSFILSSAVRNESNNKFPIFCMNKWLKGLSYPTRK